MNHLFKALMSAGAYGFVMASNYNTRPMPAEILVEGDTVEAIGGFAALSHNADICQRHAVYLRSQDGLHARFTRARRLSASQAMPAPAPAE